MRITHLIIENNPPLPHLDIIFKPVTLIKGDNERGKTTLINWISKGLFERPEKKSIWGTIGSQASVQMEVFPYHNIYDGQRMKNLLFVQSQDLFFKNDSEDTKYEFWNNQIHALLYGQDNISNQLQGQFFTAMGVSKNKKNTWLIQLHDNLYELKQELETLIPDIEKLQQKEYELHRLNDKIGSLDQEELKMRDQEDLFFLAEQLNLGYYYCSLLDQETTLHDEYQQYHLHQENMNVLENKLLELERNIDEQERNILTINDELLKINQNHEELEADPYKAYNSSLGENLFGALAGILFLCSSFVLALRSLHESILNPVKLLSLFCFLSGFYFLSNVLFKIASLQNIVQHEKESFFFRFALNRSLNDYTKKHRSLEKAENLLKKLEEEYDSIKKQLRMKQPNKETIQELQRKYKKLESEINKILPEVENIFHTDNPENISKEVGHLELFLQNKAPNFNYQDLRLVRREKSQFSEQKNEFSNDYETLKYKITKKISPLIENLKNSEYKQAVAHFYPEIMELQYKEWHQISSLIDMVDHLLDNTSRDRYNAEQLVSVYDKIESHTQMLLEKTMMSRFFTQVISYVFGGKYKTFIPEFQGKNIKIFAITGHEEYIPLEQLSFAAISQFWLCLRLTLARTILNQEEGIILLDDPFYGFDTLRKQSFIELLNTFAHEGWQIICTITYDPYLEEEFQNIFGNALKIVDLNHDI